MHYVGEHMLDQTMIDSISTTALSPIDLFLALHFGLGIDPALLRLKVKQADLIDALREGSFDTLIVDEESTPHWDKSDDEIPNALAISERIEPEAMFSGRLQQATVTALNKFLRLAATPEQRTALAERYKLAYDDLTSWVVQVDLLRLGPVDRETAELLALGVWGVHDLAFRTDRTPLYPDHALVLEVNRRVAELRVTLEQKIETLTSDALRARLRTKIAALNLRKLVTAARSHAERHPPQVVTATEVLVIVKGAGDHAQDDTLNGFLNGFWPALKAVHPAAAMTQRRDMFSSGYLSAPHDDGKHAHCTEVEIGERRIWIKESYWENELHPPSALWALRVEWRMATYAFGSMIYELVAPSRTSERENNRGQYFKAFFVQYCPVFAFLMWTLWNSEKNYIDLNVPLIDVPWTALYEWSYLSRLLPATIGPGLVSILATGLLAIVLAWLFARRRAQKTYRAKIAREENPDAAMERLPTLSGALIWIALAAFLLNPLRYLLGLVLLILVQVLQIMAREIAWPFHTNFNSDVDFSQPYVKGGRLWREDNRAAKLWLSPFVYRFTVVMSLPVAFFVLGVVSILALIPGVAGIVATVKKFMSGIISGFLGDVVTYASDPAQAHRIRSVVETDIKFFHLRPDVSQIHVLAHSQGTPITFETLFHYLPDLYRGKIKSYITLGSILSYYHQTNPVLDELFVQRFPRRPYPQFAHGFRWINFWNFNDPITEFYGLDEYQHYEYKPRRSSSRSRTPRRSPARSSTSRPSLARLSKLRLSPASPTNIKTRGHWFPYSSHAEYWNNIREVQVPLVCRLLGDDNPEEWQRLTDAKWDARRCERGYLWEPGKYLDFVSIFWTRAAAGLGFGAWLLWQAATWLWSWGATNPLVNRVYSWLIKEWNLPFTDQKLSLAVPIRAVVDNPHIMRHLNWLVLLLVVLVVLLVLKTTIAERIQPMLKRSSGAIAQPTPPVSSSSSPGTTTT